MAISSLISQDCIVSGATAQRSLLFTGVKMGSFSSVDEGGDPALLQYRPRRAAAAA